jgi:hypothetical protein
MFLDASGATSGTGALAAVVATLLAGALTGPGELRMRTPGRWVFRACAGVASHLPRHPTEGGTQDRALHPWGGRKARTRGLRRIATDIDTRAAVVNWARLDVLGLFWNGRAWAAAPPYSPTASPHRRCPSHARPPASAALKPPKHRGSGARGRRRSGPGRPPRMATRAGHRPHTPQPPQHPHDDPTTSGLS